jgi:hypothetical protein
MGVDQSAPAIVVSSITRARGDCVDAAVGRRCVVTVSDRSSVGFSWWVMARRSSSASIHRARVPTGRRGSGTRDFVPACRPRGESAFGTPGTSTVAPMHSETRDRRHAAADSRGRMEQRCGRTTAQKSRAFCGCGVLFLLRAAFESVFRLDLCSIRARRELDHTRVATRQARVRLRLDVSTRRRNTARARTRLCRRSS